MKALLACNRTLWMPALAGICFTTLAIVLTAHIIPRRFPPSTAPTLALEESLPSPPTEANAVANYDLLAELDPIRHEIRASGTIALRNTSQVSLDALFFHAYLNAFADERSVFLSQRLPGGRGSAPLTSPGSIVIHELRAREWDADLWQHAINANPGHPEDKTDWKIPLPKHLGPGETLHITARWTSRLPSIVERAGFHESFHMVAQWFPKLAKLNEDGSFAHFPYDHLSEFFADFGSYRVTLRVPKNYRVAAVGELIEEREDASSRVFRFEQSNVHDFAFAAYDRFETIAASSGHVRIEVYYPPRFETAARSQLETIAFGLKELRSLCGDYPYRVLRVVIPPEAAWEAGGMEYPTLITTGGAWYEPEAIGRQRLLALHELAHQCFYGMVATDERSWPFMDEGLATFTEAVIADRGWPNGSVTSMGPIRVSSMAFIRDMGLRSNNTDVLAKPAYDFPGPRSHGLHVYYRAAALFATLDRTYPPHGMQRVLQHFTRTNRFRHPTPHKLIQDTEEVLGKNASENLRIGLFERGWIDLALTDVSCTREEDGYRCTVLVARRGTLSLPAQLRIELSDGSHLTDHFHVATDTARIVLHVHAPIVAAVIDPEHGVILDEDLTNNAIDLRGPRRPWMSFHRASMLAAAVLSWALP